MFTELSKATQGSMPEVVQSGRAHSYFLWSHFFLYLVSSTLNTDFQAIIKSCHSPYKVSGGIDRLHALILYKHFVFVCFHRTILH